MKAETEEHGGSGASLGSLALIGSSRDFLLNASLCLTGFCLARCGYLMTGVLGGGLLVVGMLLDSVVPIPWMFLTFSGFSGLGSALLFMPSGVLPFLHFSGPKLPIVVGVAAAGGGFGTVFLNLLLEGFLDAWDRRTAQRVFAMCLLGVLSLNTLVLWYSTRQHSKGTEAESHTSKSEATIMEEAPHNAPKENCTIETIDVLQCETQGETQCEALSSECSEMGEEHSAKKCWEPCLSRSFLLLNLGLVLYMCGFTVPYTHLIYYAQQQNYAEAPSLLSTLGAMSIVGRLF